MTFALQSIILLFLFLPARDLLAQERVNNPEYGPYQDQSDDVLGFQLLAQYGAEEEPFEAMLPSRRAVRSIVTDSDDNVYVLDVLSFQIKSFTADGSFRWAAGQEGEGPGDLSKPGYMFMGPDEDLYVIDNGSASLRVFDLNGEFKEEKIFPAENIYQSYYGSYIGDDRILISKTGRMQRYEAEFIILNIAGDDMTVEDRFHLGQKPELRLSIGYYFYPPHRYLDDGIAIGNAADYRFTIHDLSGKRIITSGRDKNVFNKITNIAEEHVAVYLQLAGISDPPVRITDDHFLKTSHWAEDPDNIHRNIRADQYDILPALMNSVDLLNSDYELLYSLETNGKYNPIGEIIHSDGNGHIYTIVSAPYPQIRKYKVILDLDD